MNLSIILCYVKIQLPLNHTKFNQNPAGLKCCDPHLVIFHSENTKQSIFIHSTLICNITSVVDRQLLRKLSDQILIRSSPT